MIRLAQIEMTEQWPLANRTTPEGCEVVTNKTLALTMKYSKISEPELSDVCRASIEGFQMVWGE